MIFEETPLAGAYVVRLQRIEDDRGFFARTFCEREFAGKNLAHRMLQSNTAVTRKAGILRGLHYQTAPHAEAKLVRCIRGAVYDVMADVRPDSPTFRSWFGVELTAENRAMVYVPEGMAHGYLALADDSELFYQVSAFYAPGAERGVRWNDPAFGVRWPEAGEFILSEKDRNWPDFSG
jgi:dTDP-4-dehydrorhamnose 3,5-epimerase